MGLTTMKSARDVANPKRGECPNRKALKGVCPSMMTRKDKKIDRVVIKYVKDLINSRMGVCLNVTTHKDQEIDKIGRKICKTSDELKNGGMPQCRIVTNIRHGISPYKTLRDMLNDDAKKKTHIEPQ